MEGTYVNGEPNDGKTGAKWSVRLGQKDGIAMAINSKS